VFYANLQVTAWEIFASLAIGSGLGITVGIILGANRFLGAAYEPYVYYIAPTPRIIFFPVMIMWFGVGVASKIALGALSCFFTVALSTAGGMREVDKVLIRVGRSFRATPWQMALMFFISGLFAWKSLTKNGAAAFLAGRVVFRRHPRGGGVSVSGPRRP
jgi:ABC-type nitrate/sulfonate/bicarbonate transport system permease component